MHSTMFAIVASMVAIGVQLQPTARQTETGLAGTSWQLTRIQYMNDKVLTPDDPAKYTLAFGADGRVSMRIDCNRATGPWKSPGKTQLLIGPLAVTRAMCPSGSLHDRVVREMSYVRSYVLKDGHLFLSLMADGGIYEFEPAPHAGTPATASQIGPVTYTCTDTKGERVVLKATFRKTDPPSVQVQRGDETVVAPSAPSASGAKYEGQGLMFWEHQGEATVTWKNSELTCKPVK